MFEVFDKIYDHLNKQLPFVLFCKPNSDKLIGVFQRDANTYQVSNFTESGFVFSSFDGTKKIIIPTEHSDVIVSTFTNKDFLVTKNVVLEHSNLEKENFEDLVQNGINAILSKQFKKVVLSRKEVHEVPDIDLEKSFKSLCFLYDSAFKYCFFHPETGMWLGATPEQFLKLNDNQLHTVSLAGTQLYSENLSWQGKEKDEQEFVTQFIVNELLNYANKLYFSEPETVKAGNLAHLKTIISAHIQKEFLGEIILKLHPTPAVCGLPKESAFQFIIENEGYNREFYAGFLGELNIDFTNFNTLNSDLYVNLRCMKKENNKINIFVGCGITKDSNPEKEFIETVNKSITIKKII